MYSSIVDINEDICICKTYIQILKDIINIRIDYIDLYHFNYVCNKNNILNASISNFKSA